MFYIQLYVTVKCWNYSPACNLTFCNFPVWSHREWKSPPVTIPALCIWLLRIGLYLPDSTRTRYWTFAHLVQLRMRCCWNAYLKKWKLENLMSNKMNLRKQIDGNPCRAWIGIDNNENVYFPTYRVPKVSE